MAKEFIGNPAAVDRLARRASGTGGHAYLITGPAGIGKRTLAERFAAALLCERKDGPCEQCASCRLRAAGNHPDFHALPREGNLTIAQIRELSHALSLAPHSGRHQVGLIPDAERLGIPAQNALLKLLEEPPASAVLVLTAPSPATLLPTTVSRCQRVPLGPVPPADLISGLKQQGITAAEDIAARSASRPGQAIKLAEDPEAASAAEQSEERLLAALKAPIPERLGIAKELSEDPEELKNHLDTWISLYRSSLRNETAGSAAAVTNLLPLAKRIDGLIRLFAARRKLRYNPNTQLLVEQLLLNLGN